MPAKEESAEHFQQKQKGGFISEAAFLALSLIVN